MVSLKDLKNRITSITSTKKITKAMQMVASVKLRRAQESVKYASPYAIYIKNILFHLSTFYKNTRNSPKLLSGNGFNQCHLLVVITADRGLCGSFNTNIIKKVQLYANKLLIEGKDVKIFYIGKKGFEVLNKVFKKNYFDKFYIKKFDYINAEKIGNYILNMFAINKFDVCSIFYSKFENVLKQVPTHLKVIPLDFNKIFSNVNFNINLTYEYESSQKSILEVLLPINLKMQIFNAILENNAGEMSSKMTAMDNATNNAEEMINNLTLNYNRQRQAQITKELIEIISGAEAL